MSKSCDLYQSHVIYVTLNEVELAYLLSLIQAENQLSNIFTGPDKDVISLYPLHIKGQFRSAEFQWRGVITTLFLGAINYLLPHVGMDVEKHGEPAYPVAAWKEAWGEFNSKSGLCSQHSSMISPRPGACIWSHVLLLVLCALHLTELSQDQIYHRPEVLFIMRVY